MSNLRKYVFAAGIVSFLMLATISLTSYMHSGPGTSGQADSLELGSFVEPGFPFISTSVDARKLGPAFPSDNQAARTLALQLGDSAYACFDTDLLRWSVAWTGKFLPMVLMAQISYKDFFNKNNKIANLTGNAKFATGMYAGWSVGPPALKEPVKNPDWKALPADQARWNGVYVYENKAILSYRVKNTEVFEMPSSAHFGKETAFIRSFQVGQSADELFLIASEISNIAGMDAKSKILYVYQGASKDTVTALAVMGKGSWQPALHHNKYLTMRVPASSKTSEVSVVMWKGPASEKGAFEKFLKTKPAAFPDFKKGGPDPWKGSVATAGKLAPDTAAFVTDQLTLPLPNPWKRNVRVADIAFFKNGDAAVITFDGDVWTVKGIDKNLQNLSWKRFASGMHEPMSIEVVRDTVYVFGREGIVKLHDLNRDGAADFYENFSNVMSQSPESREWAADLVYAPDGSFYIAKGGSLNNGPGMTAPAAKGFRVGSDQNGAVLKISPDGRDIEMIATGLRGPYLGLHPQNGTLTASDQQGNFVPSTPIYLIHKGDYYGVPPTMHRNDNPPVAPPLTWIPHNVDRSAIGQAWLTGNKMGPLNGNLIHFSFGQPGLFRVLIDSAATPVQGGVAFIHADYPAPTSKGALNPADEQLYITGFNLWGSQSTGISSVLRLRYTGKQSYMPNHFRAGKQGVVIRFDAALDKNSVKPENFEVKRYNYQRTEEYGSGHFKLDGSVGEEILPVAGAYLGADQKTILLLLPEMTEIMQMEVAYKLLATDGRKMNDHFYYTVNQAADMDLGKYKFGNVDLALLNKKIAKPAEEVEKPKQASAALGREVFQKMACAGCHSEGTRTDGMYGPPFQNLYKSERHFSDGTKVIADENYIRESILTPSKRIVKGYAEEMPSFVGVLSDTEIESVVLFIKSLKK